jgi:hypothetical protein
VPSPNPGGFVRGDVLWDVASDPARNVWAVGQYDDGSHDSLLVERWTGEPWDVLPAPGPSHEQQALLAVSPLAGDDVWAAGLSFDEGASASLVRHWDGEVWSVVPTPELGAETVLEGIGAVSPGDVWAVGSVFNF